MGGLGPAALPSVLAIPLAEHAGEGDPLLRLWHMSDVAELTLRVCAALALADWAAAGGLPRALRGEVASRLEQPTLGKWRGLVLALAARPPDDSRVRGLADFATGPLDQLLAPAGARDDLTRSLLALRNRIAHGGGMSRELAAELEQAHAPRFAHMIDELDWLAALRFVVPSRGGLMSGPSVDLVPAEAADVDRARAAAGDVAEAVVAVSDAAPRCPLWPLMQYGLPRVAAGARAPTRAVPLIYARRGEVRLQLTPVGLTEVAMADSSEAAVAPIAALCAPLEPAMARGRAVGFARELRRDAGQLVGRARELEALVRAAEPAAGVARVTGPAGIGKSFLVARLAMDADATERPVLAWRFRAGDPRCGREPFLRFACEHLAELRGAPAPSPRRSLIDQLLELLAERPVLFVLDGVDEVAAVDDSFAGDVVARLGEHARVICALRPDPALEGALGGEPVFPGGLPGLGAADVRAMLLAKIGPLSRKLVAGDRDADDAAVNPFVDRVVEAAAGLPIYVAYVIGDILSGRLTDFDDRVSLPPSLDAYHAELLRGCAVGSVHQALTPLMCALALAEAPLTAGTLAALLAARRAVTADAAGRDAVAGALATAGAMVRRVAVDGDDAAYALFHRSLRAHLRGSPELAVAIDTAREALADAAAAPGDRADAARAYLYRHGIVHLIDAGRARDAARLVTDLGYLVARLDALGAAGIGGLVADADRVARARDGDTDVDSFAAFLRRNAHLVQRGGAVSLLQAAVAEAVRSPITEAAERWLAAGTVDRPWLRRLDRPERPAPSATVATFEGHEAAVTGVVVLDDGRAVSAGGDATLRVWDVDSGEELARLSEPQETLSIGFSTAAPAADCIRPLPGHAWTVWAIAALPGARVAAAHGARGVKLWDPSARAIAGDFERSAGYVWSLATSPDGALLAGACDDGVVRLWRTADRSLLRELRGHDGWVGAVAFSPDGQLLASGGGDGTIRLWHLDGDGAAVLAGHRAYVSALCFAFGALFSAGGDGAVVRWDPAAARETARWAAHARGVWCLAAAGDQLLSGGRDGLVHVWNPTDGARVHTLRGHARWVWQLAVQGDGRLLSASADDTVRLWDLERARSSRGRPTHDGPVLALALLPGGAATAGADGAIKLWDPPTGRSLRTIAAHDGEARGLAVVGDQLISIGEDRLLRRFDHSGTPRGEHALERVPTCLASAGDALLLGFDDGTVALHGVDGEPIAVLGQHGGAVRVLAVDGTRAASAGDDAIIRVWDLPGRRCTAELRGHTSAVRALAFAGDALISAGYTGDVRIWDPARGRGRVARDDGRRMVALAIWPDGRLILSSPDGKTLELWPAAGGSALVSWPGEAPIAAVAVDADRRILVADVAGGLTCLRAEGVA